jgi:ribonuclease HI
MAKYYVVWVGRRPGVFSRWADCDAQVTGFPGARFKAFENRAAAEQALEAGYAAFAAPKAQIPTPEIPAEALESYAVDAACNGSPGNLEYRCVKIGDRTEVFHQGPFTDGTNNIGEFLAIVHALALFKKQAIVAPLYSDSRIALSWIAAQTCRTNLVRTARNETVFQLIARAEIWLRDNEWNTPLRLWRTSKWGENPADFGRK